jgi:hypothetical protein
VKAKLAKGEYVMSSHAVGTWLDMDEYLATTPDGLTVANGVSYRSSGNTVEDVSDPESEMTWTCEPDVDSDPIELVIDPASYAALVAKARAYDRLVSNCTCSAIS